jgi:hypothetical protein
MDQVTDLIARYLQAVKFWLPKKQQDDIIAELSEDLRAQIEERESLLGRKLNGSEVETLLRQRGSPIMVANSYLPQQQLIGPLLFPIYTFVLKIVSLCILIPAFVGWIAAIISHALRNVAGTWIPPFAVIAGHLWSGWFTAMAVVTLIFAVIERSSAKTQILENWNPRNLPPLRPARAIPRSSSVIEIVVHLCVLVWWATNMVAPLNLRIGNVHVAFTPAWELFYWAILVLTLFNAALSSINLMRPWWTSQRVAARLFLDVVGSAFFCWMLRANLVATITWPSATPDKSAFVLTQVNLWLERAFPYAILICLIIALTNAWRLIRAVRKADDRPLLTALV